MKNYSIKYPLLICLITLIAGAISCKKESDEITLSDEPISFIVPSDLTLSAQPGETIDYSVKIVSDKPIDTLRAGFMIDSINITSNLTLTDMDSIFLTTGFPNVSNQQTYSGQFTIPDSIPGVRLFNVGSDGDKIRLLFRMEAQDNVAEKQLKINLIHV